MHESELHSYLVTTKYCDYDHVLIDSITKGFKAKHQKGDKRTLAIDIFYFVRDYTEYRVGHWTKTASETFVEKSGTCTNNANLFVALCRSVGIPAGYGILEVVGPKYFGPIILESFSRRIANKSKHIYAYVYLDSKWIKCDPSDDAPLSLNTQHLNPPSKVVEWDGINDAVLNLNPSHIISDAGPIANIDDIISKKQRMLLYIPVKIANLYIQFLRESGSVVTNLDELEPFFLKWLRKNYFAYFLFYYVFLKMPEKSETFANIVENDV